MRSVNHVSRMKRTVNDGMMEMKKSPHDRDRFGHVGQASGQSFQWSDKDYPIPNFNLRSAISGQLLASGNGERLTITITEAIEGCYKKTTKLLKEPIKKKSSVLKYWYSNRHRFTYSQFTWWPMIISIIKWKKREKKYKLCLNLPGHVDCRLGGRLEIGPEILNREDLI